MAGGYKKPLFTVDSTIFRRRDAAANDAGETLLVQGTTTCAELDLSLDTSDTPVTQDSIEDSAIRDTVTGEFALLAAIQFVRTRCARCVSHPGCKTSTTYEFGVLARNSDVHTLPNAHFDNQVPSIKGNVGLQQS